MVRERDLALVVKQRRRKRRRGRRRRNAKYIFKKEMKAKVPGARS